MLFMRFYHTLRGDGGGGVEAHPRISGVDGFVAEVGCLAVLRRRARGLEGRKHVQVSGGIAVDSRGSSRWRGTRRRMKI